MKTTHTLSLVAACGTLLLSAGCGKKEPTPPSTTKVTPAPATQATNRAAVTANADKEKETMNAAALAKSDALKQAEAGKAAADKLVLAAAAATQERDRIEGQIDMVRNLTGQNNFVEALKVLKELSQVDLTPQQQAVVDALKQTAEQQAAKAVTDQAVANSTKAIGGALGGKQ